MQMGSKFPGGEEGGCTRAAGRCKFPPGRERVAGCGEFGVGGQGREQGLGAGGERGVLVDAISRSKFPRTREPARLLAS